MGGGAIGGVLGLLVGVGAIPIPGLGPAFAAGSIATAIGGAASGVGVGATAGALIGAMLGLSVEEEQAHAYAEGVKRGGVLVLAEVEAAKVNRVRAILDEAEAIDIEELRQTWEQEEGWTRFEADNQSSDHSA